MVQQGTEKGGCFPMKVEGLTADIEAAEEEIVRWKQAATEEAAAGAAVLEEVDSCNAEVGDIGPCRAISNLEALLDMTHSFKRQ
jgi:hypothetical protein